MTSDLARFSILTPPGRGAVASIGVRGERATSVVAQLFQPASGRPLDTHPFGRIVFGRWRASGGPGEELIVCCRDATHIEIHCHGGPMAAATIAADLADQGATCISGEEWCRDAEVDLISAEARTAVAEARTARGATILLDQYRGALRRAAECMIVAITRRERETAQHQIETLLQSARIGMHAAVPWQVALAGRPNVGKSRLLNALAGFQRAIVSPEAGTTRDVVTTTVVFDGWRIALSDTAGHRAITGDPLEAAGMTRAREQWVAADLVLLVADAGQDWNDADDLLFASLPSALIVHNKSDLGDPTRDTRPTGMAVSARTGAGIEALSAAIVQRLVPNPPAPGQAVLFHPRQVNELRAAQAALERGDDVQTITSLRRFITG